MSQRTEQDKKVAQAQSGTARASLLGLSDGLITNVSLILGVAGAGVAADVVRLAGIASLIAGACSMAVGEYVSMRGQVELLTSVLERERKDLHDDPIRSREALVEMLVEDGISEATSKRAADELAHHTEKAISMYTRHRFGINPDELGSAWGSAGSSFITFSAGAVVPLIPWFFLTGMTAVWTSLILAAVFAFGIGTYLGSTTNNRWLRAGLRQLLVLVLAATATYFIGRLFHAQIG